MKNANLKTDAKDWEKKVKKSVGLVMKNWVFRKPSPKRGKTEEW